MFPYVFSIENVEEEDNEVKIIGLKATNNTKTVFYIVETYVSYIGVDQIIDSKTDFLRTVLKI